MKNYRTPRTQAECEYAIDCEPTVGYPPLPRQRRYTLADVLYGVVLFVAMAGIGVLLAWRA